MAPLAHWHKPHEKTPSPTLNTPYTSGAAKRAVKLPRPSWPIVFRMWGSSMVNST